MLSHGLTTGALFVMVTILHERTGTRRLGELGGVWARSPVFGGFFLLFALSSLGLPGLANFSGEILVLLGTFLTHPLWAALGMLGVVFAAAYMLRMVQGVLWGAPRHERPWRDLSFREWLLIAPLAVMVVWLGLYPQTFLTPLAEPVRLILAGKGGLP
jgi:NADH-quinone oxidoreductase subunit M